MAPHLVRTEESLHRMAGGRSLLDAALSMQQDRIRTAADEAFAESIARFRDNLGSAEQLLDEASRGVTSRNLTDLEEKVNDMKHQAIQDVFKSAEWYEKKAQTHIQNVTERAVEQAGSNLREKAGEISSTFTSELDNSSRNFVGHTQSQMEDMVREAFERARSLFAEASETTTAAFTDEIQRTGRQELEGFGESLQKSVEEARQDLEGARRELSQKVTSEQEEFLRRFQGAMNKALDAGVAEAHAKVEASFSPLLDSWKVMTDRHQGQLAQRVRKNERAGHGTASHATGERFESVDAGDHNIAGSPVAGCGGQHLDERGRETARDVHTGFRGHRRNAARTPAANCAQPDGSERTQHARANSHARQLEYPSGFDGSVRLPGDSPVFALPGIMQKLLHTWPTVHICASGRAISLKKR